MSTSLRGRARQRPAARRSIALLLSWCPVLVGCGAERAPVEPVREARQLASSIVTEQQLLQNDGATDDRFGASVAVSGDTAFVGAPTDGGGDTPPGTVHVYRRTGGPWVWQASLVADDPVPAQRFGASVAASDDTVVVGAHNGVDPGSAYVFVRAGDDWTQEAMLAPGAGEMPDYFGAAVAIAGDTVVVGASRMDASGTEDAGAAYAYVRANGHWSAPEELVRSAGTERAYFGASVAVAGDTILVGAPGKEPSSTAPGTAHVFTRSGGAWVEGPQLAPDDGHAGDLFGSAVALLGETAVVGARLHDSGASLAVGSAHVFVGGGAGWSLAQSLRASDGAAQDRFGVSVALTPDAVVVGARKKDGGSGTLDVGAAYVFVRSRVPSEPWRELHELVPALGVAGGHFGVVAASGDVVLVGASPGDAMDATAAGAAYVYPLFRKACTTDLDCAAGSTCLEGACAPCPEGGCDPCAEGGCASSGAPAAAVADADEARSTTTFFGCSIGPGVGARATSR